MREFTLEHDAGFGFSEHIHEYPYEHYLECLKGSYAVTFKGRTTTLNPGDTICHEWGYALKCRALENGSVIKHVEKSHVSTKENMG